MALYRTGVLAPICLIWGLVAPQTKVPGHDASKIQVLLLTGYNSTPNHHWREIDPILRDVLERSGKFEVRIEEEPRGITADTFAFYDVLLLDYSDYTPSLGVTWPEATRQAYLKFLEDGGGVVAFHVTIGSFPEWPDFQRTLGIADARRIGHGPYHTFRVKIVRPEDSLVEGLLREFDEWGEVYNGFKLTSGANVLATAYDDVRNCLPNGTHCGGGGNEPILWTTRTGAGRVFVTTLGHDRKSVDSPEFQKSLVRGAEWAAGQRAAKGAHATTK